MKTQLILDGQSVSDFYGVGFHLNTAKKHPANPVLIPGEPHQWDSLQVSWPGTVLYSPSDKKFRCWYSGLDVVQSPGRYWLTGYAESDDGVNWRKPELGQVSFLERPTNRIKTDWTNGQINVSCVFENPLDKFEPSQRFGAYWGECRYDEGTKKTNWSKTLTWSPDGINWKKDCMAYGEKSRPDLLDISQVFYDPSDSDVSFRWKAYGQIFVPSPDDKTKIGIRNIGLAHGLDVSRVKDAENRVVFSPEPGIDEEIHFSTVRKIGDDYLMLFESDMFSRNPIRGDLRLAVGKDGRNFRRIHPQSALVERGAKGMWDENLLVTTTDAMQIVNDKVYIYYFGCPNIYNSWPMQYALSPERRGSMFAPAYLGVAVMPIDRFCYAAGNGVLTTHQIKLDSGEVWLNTDGDNVQIDILDINRAPVAHGILTEEARQGVYRKVKWSGQPVRGDCYLRIAMTEKNRLFSFRYF